MRDRRMPRAPALTAMVVALSACATSYGPGPLAPGQDAQAAIDRMGTPTARYPGAEGGSRLEFARGPMGGHTYMVDVDAAQRILKISQVLDEANFNALRPGMTHDEVLYAIGRPADTMRIARQREDVWSYRYANHDCLWFRLGMDMDTGRLRDATYGPDPICDDDGPPMRMKGLR